MKPGTIVVVLPHNIDPMMVKEGWIKWYPVTDEKTPYVIRSVTTDPALRTPVYHLEEGIIGYNPHINKELGLNKECLRELLPPEDISEEIEEIMSEPVAL